MGIVHTEVPHHWNYLFCIEEDILALSRWIEFSEDNEQVYSLELARLLMTAAAEADVVAKALCRAINPQSRASSIGSYCQELLAACPEIPGAEVQMPRFGKSLRPWSIWGNSEGPPLWWRANNKVKHRRADHFREASLKNVLNAVSGLMVLLVLLSSRDQASLYPGPSVFEPRTFVYRDGPGIVFRAPEGLRRVWQERLKK